MNLAALIDVSARPGFPVLLGCSGSSMRPGSDLLFRGHLTMGMEDLSYRFTVRKRGRIAWTKRSQTCVPRIAGAASAFHMMNSRVTRYVFRRTGRRIHTVMSTGLPLASHMSVDGP